jgi:hypothetical protein
MFGGTLGHVSGKGMGVAVVDFDEDGGPDVFITNDTERNPLYPNRGDGSFRRRHYRLVWPSTTTAQRFLPWARMSEVWALFRNHNGKLSSTQPRDEPGECEPPVFQMERRVHRVQQ